MLFPVVRNFSCFLNWFVSSIITLSQRKILQFTALFFNSSRMTDGPGYAGGHAGVLGSNWLNGSLCCYMIQFYHVSTNSFDRYLEI